MPQARRAQKAAGPVHRSKSRRFLFRLSLNVALSVHAGGNESGLRLAQSRLIMLAIYPAPNPLSMFTTATLGEQLFIIPRSAARPRKLAPYPTLVGTAI